MSRPPDTATTPACTMSWAHFWEALDREVGDALDQLDGPAVDTAELGVDEVDGGLRAQRTSGNEPIGTSSWLNVADLDGLAVGFHRHPRSSTRAVDRGA